MTYSYEYQSGVLIASRYTRMKLQGGTYELCRLPLECPNVGKEGLDSKLFIMRLLLISFFVHLDHVLV